MTLSVAVMAHHKREQWVPGLVHDLGVDADVVWDKFNDRHETGLRALLAYDKSASHHLVVQDDAIVAPDLVPALEKAVAHSGEHPLALYFGKTGPHIHMIDRRYAEAKAAGVPWLAMEGPWWGVGIVVPTAHIHDLAEWYFGPEGSKVENYDRRVSRWYRKQAIDCWYTIPSLVEHRTDGNPSLTGRPGKRRNAREFIGADVSALTVDWSREPLRLWFGEITVPMTFRSPYHQLTVVMPNGRKLNFRDGLYTARDFEAAEWLARAPLDNVSYVGRRGEPVAATA